MIWAMGALLLQFHAVPQVVVPAASRVTVEAADRLRDEPVSAPAPVSEKLMLEMAPSADDTVTLEPGRLTLTPVVPAAAPAIIPVVAAPRPPIFTGRVGQGQRKAWMALAVAQHSAATFDAWSTRRAITQYGAKELNPMLKPFAGNRSIYAAVQVAPTLLDLLGRRMMTSRHSFLRKTWWLPQVLGTAASVAGGVHNMGVRR